jgi:hypothetical protein
MKFFSLLGLFISLNTFAGDLYLICSTNYGSPSEEEVFYINKEFDSESEIIGASFYEPQTTDRRVEISFTPKTRSFKAYVTDVESGDLRAEVETVLKINQPVTIINQLSCRISD